MPAPKKTDALVSRLRKLNDQGRYEEVLKELTDEALTTHNDPQLNLEATIAYNERGISLYNQKKYTEALTQYDKAIELKPDYEAAYNNRGLVWEKMGELDKAIEQYNKALELKPNYATAYNNRGAVWDLKKAWDKAIEDYNEAIKIDPSYAAAYNNRALINDKKGEPDKAIEDYNKAIELKPDYAAAYNNRGVVWDSKKEWDKAIADYSKAIEIKPDYAIAYNNRGLMWEYKGDFARALQDYDKAIEMDKNYGNAYRNRGTLFNTTNEFEKALADFNTAMALSPDLNFLQDDINELKLKLGQKPTVTEGADDAAIFMADILEKISDTRVRERIKEKAYRFLTVINKIRKYAIIAEPCPVAHYTKLLVADKLVVPDRETKLRYSNVTHMNDPEEGKVLKEVLLANNQNSYLQAYFEESRLFTKNDNTDTNIYLGSFLPASRHDDEKKDTHEDELVMWRTYGKDENKNEAAGCSIVIDSDFFYWPQVDSKPANLQSIRSDTGASQGQMLYRVLYFNKTGGIIESKKNFDTGKLEDALHELKSILNELLADREETGEKETTDGIIHRGLSELRYIFKSSNYSFENEYRVIQYFNPDNPLVQFDAEAMTIPRVLYVESTRSIKPCINRIYLGPKVPHPERWMYLELVLKKGGHNKKVRVLPSSCKFQ